MEIIINILSKIHHLLVHPKCEDLQEDILATCILILLLATMIGIGSYLDKRFSIPPQEHADEDKSVLKNSKNQTICSECRIVYFKRKKF